MLRALSTVDVVTESAEQRFELTCAGHALRSDLPGSFRPAVLMFGDDVFALFTELEHSVRIGEPAFEKVHGQPFYDYLAADPERHSAFAATRGAASPVPPVLATCDFTGAGTIADLGGGDGALLVQVLNANPDAHGILLELPEVVR